MAFVSLDIPNFRALRNLKVEELRRINILVGKNNSGKTSLLEAVELLCIFPNIEGILRQINIRKGISNMNRSALATSIQSAKKLEIEAAFENRHNEKWNYFLLIKDEVKSKYENLSNLDSYSFERMLRTQDFQHNRWKISPQFRTDEPLSQNNLNKIFVETSYFKLIYGLRGFENPVNSIITEWFDSHEKGNFNFKLSHKYPTTNESLFYFGTEESIKKQKEENEKQLEHLALMPRSFMMTDCVFIPTFIDASFLSSRYEQLLLDKQLDNLIRSAQIIDDKIVNILATPSGQVLFETTDAGMLPVHFQGEGVVRIMRILTYLLSLPPGGVCLIDEIDTGLHYTALPVMWKAVLQAAENNDVQVFATTHSDECIKALVEVLKEKYEAAGQKLEEAEALLEKADCALYRLEQEEDGTKAYRYDMDTMEYNVRAGLEIR